MAGALKVVSLESPPLSPDADTARYWLQQELSNGIYGQRESLLSKLLRGLQDFLDGISITSVPSWGSLGLVVLIVALGILAIFFGGTLRTRAVARKSAAVFEDTTATAADYRTKASENARFGDFAQALLFTYRALVRSAEERVVISEQSGRTAVEAATAIGKALPTYSGGLTEAARLFDEVIYGDKAATSFDYESLVALDQKLTAQKVAQLAGQVGQDLAENSLDRHSSDGHGSDGHSSDGHGGERR